MCSHEKDVQTLGEIKCLASKSVPVCSLFGHMREADHILNFLLLL